MLIIPAIDLKDGKCVRLRQGNMDDDTVFGEDPVKVAHRWRDAGARRLHIVDLDGAFKGQPVNAEIIHAIAEDCPDLPIQIGGGIRDEDTIQAYLDAGVSYVIIGTKAVNSPHFVADVCLEFPGHIIVGLDARDGKLATDGWSKMSHSNVTDVAHRFQDDGVEAIVFTDISKDGMMQGTNVEATVALAREITIPVIASGGISAMADVEALCEVAEDGIMGAIIGRALYEGTIEFESAQQYADNNGVS